MGDSTTGHPAHEDAIAEGVVPQSRDARAKRAETAVCEAYQRYLDWQGEWDGYDGGDPSTFLDYVNDVLGDIPLKERESDRRPPPVHGRHAAATTRKEGGG